MKKLIIAVVFASSALVLTGCGVTGTTGCCRAVAPVCSSCSTVGYTYSGSCGTNLCNAGWY